MAQPHQLPEDGVTEIRVHGVGGQTPQDLLGDPRPTQVAGDRIAGFFRTADLNGRHLEAYSWGGLTSRSFSRVLWLLLLPSMFANMAGWMARPWTTAKAPRPDRSGHGFQWIARTVALGVTINITVMNCLIALEVVAYQCGGHPACVGTGWLAPLRWAEMETHPARRLVIGATFPLAVILLWAVLSRTSRNRYERVEPPRSVLPDPAANSMAERSARNAPASSRLPDGLANEGFWNGAPAHARLTRLHLAAALAIVALFLTYCARETTRQYTVPAADYLFWGVLVLAVVSLIGCVVLLGTDPSNAAVSGVALIAGLLSLVGAVAFAWVQPISIPTTGAAPVYLPGMRAMFNVTWGLVVIPLLLMLIWCIARAVASNRTGMAPDRHVFHWAGPFVVAAVGLILCNIVTLAVIVFVSNLFGDISWSEFAVPPTAGGVIIHLYPTIRLGLSLLALGLILVLLVAVAAAAIGWLRSGARPQVRKLAAELPSEYPGSLPPSPALGSPEAWLTSNLDGPVEVPPPNSADEEVQRRRAKERYRWVRAIARWRWIGTIAPGAGYLLSALAGSAAAVVAWVCLQFLATGDAPTPPAWMLYLGVPVGLAVPPVLLALLMQGWRRPDSRRIIGVLWDVGTFFPRSFHPFAPPSYTERAVPELQRRIWYLHDHGGRVLLSCHSQGSIIAAAAMLRTSPRRGQQRMPGMPLDPPIHLVTFGSPLHKLYHWAFPLYFTNEQLAAIGSGHPGIGGVCWVNYFYRTDYVGGPALPAGPSLPAEPSSNPGPSPSPTAGNCQQNDVGPTGDIELPDPPTAVYVYGQPAPKPGSHTGYWHDRNLLAKINEIAAAIPGTERASGPDGGSADMHRRTGQPTSTTE